MCVFPSAWKTALICPLFKIRIPLSPSYTRPKANLPGFSKILEKIVHRQISQYIADNNILDPRHLGFSANLSTQIALLRLSDDVRRSIDDRKVIILIIFDFSKAFDTIPYLGLLKQFKAIGFSADALRWVYSYLTRQSQVVVDLEFSRSNEQSD